MSKYVISFRFSLSANQCRYLLFYLSRINDPIEQVHAEAEALPYSERIIGALKEKGLINRSGLTKRGIEYANHFIEGYDMTADLVEAAKKAQRKYNRQTV